MRRVVSRGTLALALMTGIGCSSSRRTGDEVVGHGTEGLCATAADEATVFGRLGYAARIVARDADGAPTALTFVAVGAGGEVTEIDAWEREEAIHLAAFVASGGTLAVIDRTGRPETPSSSLYLYRPGDDGLSGARFTEGDLGVQGMSRDGQFVWHTADAFGGPGLIDTRTGRPIPVPPETVPVEEHFVVHGHGLIRAARRDPETSGHAPIFIDLEGRAMALPDEVRGSSFGFWPGTFGFVVGVAAESEGRPDWLAIVDGPAADVWWTPVPGEVDAGSASLLAPDVVAFFPPIEDGFQVGAGAIFDLRSERFVDVPPIRVPLGDPGRSGRGTPMAREGSWLVVGDHVPRYRVDLDTGGVDGISLAGLPDDRLDGLAPVGGSAGIGVAADGTVVASVLGGETPGFYRAPPGEAYRLVADGVPQAEWAGVRRSPKAWLLLARRRSSEGTPRPSLQIVPDEAGSEVVRFDEVSGWPALDPTGTCAVVAPTGTGTSRSPHTLVDLETGATVQLEDLAGFTWAR